MSCWRGRSFLANTLFQKIREQQWFIFHCFSPILYGMDVMYFCIHFFTHPFQGLLVHMPWKILFEFLDLYFHIAYWKKHIKQLKKALVWFFGFFFLQDTDNYPDFQKNEITLGNSQHFSCISHVHVFYKKHLICSQFIFYKICKIRKPGFSCRLGFFQVNLQPLHCCWQFWNNYLKENFKDWKITDPDPWNVQISFKYLLFVSKLGQSRTQVEKRGCVMDFLVQVG